MKRLLLAALVCAAPAVASANATIIIINNDGPGEGFNDPTPATPVGGNPGTTVGQQRLNLFVFAANAWGQLIDSAVTIQIGATFDPLTCTPTGAVLGSAGAANGFIFDPDPNLPPYIKANTIYSVALTNKFVGVDVDPARVDINARFNSSLNGDPNCLGGSGWYYGFDSTEPVNSIDLLPVLMHEFGHGLGFQSFVDRTTGALNGGFDDQYTRFMFDNSVDKFWSDMTDAERLASMKRGRRVVWNGPNLLVAAPAFLAPGTALMRISSPASIAGTYQVGEAVYGPRLTGTPLSAPILIANDTTASPLGCNPYAPGTFTGRIAMIDRGVCGFTVKVKNAQDAGALAVIIADNVAGNPPPALGGTDPLITIPSVRITLEDANLIKAQLGGGVTPSLSLDLTVHAGADQSDRMMLYTPDPIIQGSSVSHFDTSATPNVLMEPNINTDLTFAVDMTLPLFRDIGWYPDADVDLVPDDEDNCVGVANDTQLDSDLDLIGDACDADDDNDGVADVTDNCVFVGNFDQANTDADAEGNACDADDDNDTVADGGDNCPLVANLGQEDRNTDGVGDACDDEDSDTVVDSTDNCPDAANTTQANADGDAQGDACDTDDDNDGVPDATDNCSLVANAGQANADADAFGDACDGDIDGDTVANAADNCPAVANTNQANSDGDAEGDACDTDADNDGILNGADNCPAVVNADQQNADADADGDACDTDDDNDTIADATDNCPLNANTAQTNSDSDATGDACDLDDDNDTILDTSDNCALLSNFPQTDTDTDGMGDACDTDDDNDGDLDTADNCVTTANPDQTNTDTDAQGNACDIDDDADGVLDTADNCALVANIGQLDTDMDGMGDACEADDDADGVDDTGDNCPVDANANQADADMDGIGDACDTDVPDDDDDDDGGGCCSTGGRNTPPLGALLLGLAVVFTLRRRRR